MTDDDWVGSSPMACKAETPARWFQRIDSRESVRLEGDCRLGGGHGTDDKVLGSHGNPSGWLEEVCNAPACRSSISLSSQQATARHGPKAMERKRFAATDMRHGRASRGCDLLGCRSENRKRVLRVSRTCAEPGMQEAVWWARRKSSAEAWCLLSCRVTLWTMWRS